MKTKRFVISLLTGLSMGASALGAPAAGGGGGGHAVAPAAPNPAILPEPGRNVPPGQPGTGQPGNSQSTPFDSPTGTATGTMSSNSVAGPATNQFPANTNMGNINSNQVNNATASQNQPISSGDRMLLTSLQQGLAAQLGTTPTGQLPVHFLINNGAVTLVGTVHSADESQRILARVQQTPGVLSVFNDLRVGTPTATATGQVQNNLTGGAGITDHAFSPGDQTLLTVVEQSAGTQLGITGASSGQMPVHFSVENGIVGVTGQLSSPQEKAALLTALQRTPGVVRVVDNVGLVNVPANGGAPGGSPLQTPPMNNQPLAPTSRDMNLTNNNSSGF